MSRGTGLYIVNSAKSEFRLGVGVEILALNAYPLRSETKREVASSHVYNKLINAAVPVQTPVPRKDALLNNMSVCTLYSELLLPLRTVNLAGRHRCFLRN
ncbi:Reverse transcriptase [Phytophthora palmivora]|uniref:Reverse transcriptase n=1 Tax=Phytophthora palmivora TaxID=4796 RepID=A0A2P4XNQ8_9STRA|nr:Reverse transcriptase [Phytophthora palmivora]